MSPQKEQILALASAVEKLKDDNLKLTKRFKTPPSKKIKDKCKDQGKKPADKQSQYEKKK